MNNLAIRPSASNRWSKCPGSVRAESGRPEDQTDAAKEGNAAHWLAEQVLKSYVETGEIFNPRSVSGTICGAEITEEMIEAVDLYVADILKVCNKIGGLQKLKIEQTVAIRRIHDDLTGTPDAWLFDHTTSVLYVWDLKFGRRLVRAEWNTQLLCYATGIIDELGVNDEHVAVDARIVQPRAYHVAGPIRSWRFNAANLRPEINQLHDAAHVAMKGSDRLVTGDHCHYCLARNDCNAYIESTINAIDVIENAGDCNGLTPDEMGMMIGLLRTSKDRVERLLDGLENEAQELIANGLTVPGWSNGHGRPSVKWIESPDDIILMGEMMGVDLRKDGVKTPKQAEKLIDPEVIKAYSKTVPGKRKLIKSDETLAYHVFKKL